MNIDLQSIVFLCVMLFLVAVTAFSLTKDHPNKEKDTHQRITDLVTDGVFIALIVIMTFVPNLGFITVAPGVSFTLIHIPVLVGASLKGAKKGALYGLAFGICSWFEALQIGAGFNLFFIYPWTAIPSRVVFGFLAGLLFSLVQKFPKRYAKSIYLAVASAFLTVLHTVLVFGNLYIFYSSEVSALLGSLDPVINGMSWTFLGLIGVGMLGEMALAFIFVPTINLSLRKAAPQLWMFEKQG